MKERQLINIAKLLTMFSPLLDLLKNEVMDDDEAREALHDICDAFIAFNKLVLKKAEASINE